LSISYFAVIMLKFGSLTLLLLLFISNILAQQQQPIESYTTYHEPLYSPFIRPFVLQHYPAYLPPAPQNPIPASITLQPPFHSQSQQPQANPENEPNSISSQSHVNIDKSAQANNQTEETNERDHETNDDDQSTDKKPERPIRKRPISSRALRNICFREFNCRGRILARDMNPLHCRVNRGVSWKLSPFAPCMNVRGKRKVSQIYDDDDDDDMEDERDDDEEAEDFEYVPIRPRRRFRTTSRFEDDDEDEY